MLLIWTQKAEEEARDAERENKIRTHLARAAAHRHSRQPGQRFDSLAEIRKAMALEPAADLRRELRDEAIAALALPDLHITKEFDGFPPGTDGVDLSDDFVLYAHWTDKGLCTIHRVADGVEIARVPELGKLDTAGFGPGRLLTLHCPSERFQLWDLSGEQPVRRLQEDGVGLFFCFNNDGRLLALSHVKDSSIHVYDTTTGRRVYSLAAQGIVGDLRLALHPREPFVACFSYYQHRIFVRDLRNGAVVASAAPPWSGGSGGCAWSPDGRTLAVPCGDQGVVQPYAFDVARPSLRPLRPIHGPNPEQNGLWLSYNPAGDRFVVRGWDGIVHLLDAVSGQPLSSTHSLATAAWGYLRFDRTGQHLAAARVGPRQRRVGLWSVADAREYRAFVHSDPVSTWGLPAVHPGSRLAAIGLKDGVALFDLETGAELAHLPMHGKRGKTVCFDGTGHLLTNDFAGLFRWPLRQDPEKRGRLIVGPPQRLPFHEGDEQIAASRDGRIIAQCMWHGYNMTAHAGGWILHPNAPMPRRVRTGVSTGVCSVSPDGRWVAFGWPIEVFDAATGKRVWESPVQAEARYCCFSPDGRWLATDGDGGRLYATGTWEPGPQLGPGRPYDISPDGTLVILGQTNGIYRLVELATGRELARLEDAERNTGPAAFTPDGTKLVVAAKNGLRVWDLRRIRAELAKLGLDWNAPPYPPPTKKQNQLTLEVAVEMGSFFLPLAKVHAVPAKRFSAHDSAVRSLVFCGDGRRAFSGGEKDGSIRLWDLETGKSLRCFKGHTQLVQALAVSRDGRRALSGGLDNTVRLWDIEKGEELHCFRGHTKWVTCVAFSPDGRHAASTSGDGTVRLWDLETGRECRCFAGHPFRPGAPWWEGSQSVVFSPDGKHILSSGYDRLLRLWDVKTGRELRTFRGHTDAVLSVAFFPDGHQAVSGGDDAVLRVWDVDSGKELRRLEGHRGHIHCVTISPDGRRILSCAEDGTARLWDAASGAQLCCLTESAGWLWTVAFSPDGRRALSGSADKMIRLWRLPDP
jgi:WD40 repeat protein